MGGHGFYGGGFHAGTALGGRRGDVYRHGRRAGCNSTESSPYDCASPSSGRYSFGLTYQDETTVDGGCPSSHILNHQDITVVLDGQGGARLITSMGTWSCVATSDGEGYLLVQCPVPPTDQINVLLYGSCADSGVTASVGYLAQVSASYDHGLSAACCESYLAQ